MIVQVENNEYKTITAVDKAIALLHFLSPLFFYFNFLITGSKPSPPPKSLIG